MHAPVRKEEEEGYITISGQETIEAKARALLKRAKERVYLSSGQAFLEAVLPELTEFAGDGKRSSLLRTGKRMSALGRYITLQTGKDRWE